MAGGLPDARRHPRAPLLANAVLFRTGELVGIFRAIDVSAGGALLEGRPPPGIAEAGVLLGISSGRSVRARARVLPRGPSRDDGSFALSFVDISPEDERAVPGAVAAFLAQSESASVLVIGRSAEASHVLRAAAGRLGHRAFPVGTPLEAVHALERPNRFAVALVEAGLTGPVGAESAGELLAHVAERHPSVRRILVSDDPHPERPPLGALVHGTLARPWTDSALYRAIAG